MGIVMLVQLAYALGGPGVQRRQVCQLLLSITVPDVGPPAVTSTKSCTLAETNNYKGVSHIGAVPRKKVTGKELGPIPKELTVAGQAALQLREPLRKWFQDQPFWKWLDQLNDQNRIAFGAAIGVIIPGWAMAWNTIVKLNGEDVTPAAVDVQFRTRKGRENQKANVAAPTAKKQGKAGAKERGVKSTGGKKRNRKREKQVENRKREKQVEKIAALENELNMMKKRELKKEEKKKCYKKEQKEANTNTQDVVQLKITDQEEESSEFLRSYAFEVGDSVGGEKGKPIDSTDSVMPN